MRGHTGLVTYPPAFRSARLGQRLGPRGSAKRRLFATIAADVFSFSAALLGVAVAGGSWSARIGFGIAFAVFQTLFHDRHGRLVAETASSKALSCLATARRSPGGHS
jgi:hypothetical protein